jgi:hypothetical protein
MKRCYSCRIWRPIEEFYRNQGRSDGRASRCIPCSTRQQWPEDQRRRSLWSKYRLTPEDFDDLVEKQQNKCAICGAPEPKFHVDHDHQTNKIRGLLCSHCNLMLGHARDNIETLLAAIEYLKTGT